MKKCSDLWAQAPLNQTSLIPHRTVTQTTQEMGEAWEGSNSEQQLWRGPSRKGPCPKQSTLVAPFHRARNPSPLSPNHTQKKLFEEKKGETGGSKQLLGFRGEDLKARESNVFWDRKRNDPSRARRQRPTRRDDSRKDLKMAPVGEESRSETAQQTLAGSQAAPSSPRSPTPTRTESCTAKAGRRARARPEPPPEELSLLPQILFRSVLPSPEEEGSGEQRIEEKQRPPPLSPSPSGNLVTVLSKYKRALYT